jgi:hypothetical protein
MSIQEKRRHQNSEGPGGEADPYGPVSERRRDFSSEFRARDSTESASGGPSNALASGKVAHGPCPVHGLPVHLRHLVLRELELLREVADGLPLARF